MSVQLQVRYKFFSHDKKITDWQCDGETNRNEPTKFMKETARDYRRDQPDYEVRFVYDKKDFV